MEAVVVVLILGMFLLFIMMQLPRRRESARRLSCQQNLMNIGAALWLYDQEQSGLPGVPDPQKSGGEASSPLKELLETLAMPDLTQALESKAKGSPTKGQRIAVVEKFTRGFACPSDTNALAGWFKAPINYRASTGSTPTGTDGGFARGKTLKLAQIEEADGMAFTAAFSERLVGTNQPQARLENFSLVPETVGHEGCPDSPASAWQGNAGSSWFRADWVSTLYNHALTPNARPSCISQDGASAFMGASSGHLGGVNVLLFDGSVKFYGSSVNPTIWKQLSTVGSPTSTPDPIAIP